MHALSTRTKAQGKTIIYPAIYCIYCIYFIYCIYYKSSIYCIYYKQTCMNITLFSTKSTEQLKMTSIELTRARATMLISLLEHTITIEESGQSFVSSQIACDNAHQRSHRQTDMCVMSPLFSRLRKSGLRAVVWAASAAVFYGPPAHRRLGRRHWLLRRGRRLRVRSCHYLRYRRRLLAIHCRARGRQEPSRPSTYLSH